VIERIERVVPSEVWIALAATLAVAMCAGAVSLVQRRRARRQALRLEAVRAEALTDLLTGVLNRRGFLDAAERELARARRHQRPFALAFVDLRGLKAINDSEGHQAGDELIRQTARLLQESSRADDVVGRIGGDELGLLLAEHSAPEAEAAADRIVARVAARRKELRLRYPWELTVGTAAYPADGQSVQQLLAAADRRLYEQRGIRLRANGRAPQPANGRAPRSANGHAPRSANGHGPQPSNGRTPRSANGHGPQPSNGRTPQTPSRSPSATGV
jgi:diguanylate cyclase (GGDEF)-like protein